jgi:hypothetical protein
MPTAGTTCKLEPTPDSRREEFMKTPFALFAILALPAAYGIAGASDLARPSLLALPMVEAPAPEASTIVSVGGPGYPTRYESIRYRPRYSGHHPSYEEPRHDNSSTNAFFQIHGGLFDPSGDLSKSALFGARLGTSIDNRIQLGVATDVSHRTDHESQVVGTGTLPGGGTVEREVDLSEVTSNLVPIQGFLQVSPGGSAGPYVGVSGGYEALFVNATDFATGEDFNATFDGWGWQAYGGFAFPITSQARLFGEGFYNWADLDRTVDDPTTGAKLREVVNVDGAGARFGLSWSF